MFLIFSFNLLSDDANAIISPVALISPSETVVLLVPT